MLMSRRTLLAYGSLLGFSRAVLDAAEALAEAGPMRVRENIKTFAQNANKVAALRAAVGKMQTRSNTDANDLLGWHYWASVHGTDKPIPADLKGIYAQCDHSTFMQFPFRPSYVAEHFMSWHRPFLFFFEATLKAAAKEAGITTALELPYWNWYVDGDLPKIFTEGDESSNPLWHKRKHNGVDSKKLGRAFFTEKDLLPTSASTWTKSFSVPIELDPHGVVHDILGFDMGDIRTSARDPIFWLHHANIDRLWTSWINMGDGRANPPPGSTWAQKTWPFDKAGQMKQSAGAVTDSEKSLNYRYDDYTPFPAVAPAGPAPMPTVVAQGPTVQVEGAPTQTGGGMVTHELGKTVSTTTVSTTSSLSLGNQSVAVDMKLAPATQNQLHTFAAATAPSDITGAWLVLENVEIGPDGAEGGFSFSIKVTLPDASGGVRELKLGQLGRFTWPAATPKDGTHDHTPKAVTLTIPLKDVLQELDVANPADLAKGLRIVFEAVHPETPGANPQFVKIGAVSIKTSTAPIQ
jgi:hypothetical protein